VNQTYALITRVTGYFCCGFRETHNKTIETAVVDKREKADEHDHHHGHAH
jgi:hypothetical protein